MTRLTTLLAIPASAFALVAADRPPTFADVQPGVWEILGALPAKTPVRQCFADVVALARFEHRGKPCSAKVLKSAGGSAAVEYSCAAAGFGHSEIDILTPRSLRISTQGISGGLPFNYVLQARRVGDCEKIAPPAAH